MRSYRKMWIDIPAFRTIVHTPTPGSTLDQWRKVYFPFGKSPLATHYDLQGKFHLLSGVTFGIQANQLRIDFMKNGVTQFSYFGADLANQIFPSDDYANHPLD